MLLPHSTLIKREEREEGEKAVMGNADPTASSTSSIFIQKSLPNSLCFLLSRVSTLCPITNSSSVPERARRRNGEIKGRLKRGNWEFQINS